MMPTYRFYVQLQQKNANLATSAGSFSHPPTGREAKSILAGLLPKGKAKLSKKDIPDFERAIDGLSDWISRNKGASFSGNGDVARKEFGGYRVDIGVGGEMSGKWFE